MMSRAQGEALATFVNRLRPDWDHPGIVAAIGKAAHLGSPADVAHALITLAENRELTSPGMLHQQGKHWKRPDGEHTGPNISHNVRCPEHPLNFHPCPQCAAKKCPPPEEYLEAKAEALAARPRAAATPTPKTQRTDAESAALARKRLDKETR